jgi:hypothetical protein
MLLRIDGYTIASSTGVGVQMLARRYALACLELK